MSDRLQKSLAFRFMRWRLGIKGYDAETERQLEAKLIETINQSTWLDAAVVLAFDAVHDDDGRLDEANTHFYVTNDYVIELAARYPKVLFGASVHPYRKDAVAEIERCVKAGAALMKWLPITQNFDPADERCIPFYDALAHHRLPLLSHTGGEKSLPNLDTRVADPKLLELALRRGVTVIAAHCGTRSVPSETDFVPEFMAMAQRHEHFYGDTSALCLPTRSYAFDRVLHDPAVRAKLVHGSDWPIIALPPMMDLGLRESFKIFLEPNWMRRDILVKQKLGFEDAYWRRGAQILRLPQ